MITSETPTRERLISDIEGNNYNKEQIVPFCYQNEKEIQLKETNIKLTITEYCMYFNSILFVRKNN